MFDRLIFVSCGKRTQEETQLGRKVEAEINRHEGFKAYLVENVQNLDTLGHNVFEALRRCAGAVVLLHAREVTRSSMWINQELAILAYRRFFEAREIPILVFKDENASLEGAMSAFIVNAKPLPADQMVIDEVDRWLTDTATQGPPDEQAVFNQKWGVLTAEDRMILKALIEEGGQMVKEVSIRLRLRGNGLDYAAILKTRLAFMTNQNLVTRHHNIYDGDEISLHFTWQWYIWHAVFPRW
jgi:hypothetical protein